MVEINESKYLKTNRNRYVDCSEHYERIFSEKIMQQLWDRCFFLFQFEEVRLGNGWTTSYFIGTVWVHMCVCGGEDTGVQIHGKQIQSNK